MIGCLRKGLKPQNEIHLCFMCISPYLDTFIEKVSTLVFKMQMFHGGPG